jgi:hypothetical protein
MEVARRPWGWMLGASVVLLACSAHPVGPARTFDVYEGKAATTAASALSSVETVRLAARTGADDHGFGGFLGQVVADQEDVLSGVEGTFLSIQPPDGRADRVREELGDLLASSLDHIAEVRVAIRRGQLHDLLEVGAPLGEDAEGLRRFLEDHS